MAGEQQAKYEKWYHDAAAQTYKVMIVSCRAGAAWVAGCANLAQPGTPFRTMWRSTASEADAIARAKDAAARIISGALARGEAIAWHDLAGRLSPTQPRTVTPISLSYEDVAPVALGPKEVRVTATISHGPGLLCEGPAGQERRPVVTIIDVPQADEPIVIEGGE